MSKEMQARLREEYYGLGGSPNKVGTQPFVATCAVARCVDALVQLVKALSLPTQAMSANYYLIIIGVISFLAVLSWLTGAI